MKGGSVSPGVFFQVAWRLSALGVVVAGVLLATRPASLGRKRGTRPAKLLFQGLTPAWYDDRHDNDDDDDDDDDDCEDVLGISKCSRVIMTVVSSS